METQKVTEQLQLQEQRITGKRDGKSRAYRRTITERAEVGVRGKGLPDTLTVYVHAGSRRLMGLVLYTH